MKSVFGSFIKEIVLRLLITASLYMVHFGWMSLHQFVLATTVIYFLTMLIMVYFALRVKMPSFSLHFPFDKKAVLTYTAFIILSGTVASLLLDVDKFMLSQYINIDNVAFYSVAIFMTTAIAVPSRAMHQIAYPVTARLMTEGKHDELNAFYKKTSITLQIVGGYVFLGILVNLKQVYQLMPPGYEQGVFVVFTVGMSRYFDLILGNNNAIIFNSVYYRMVLFLGLLLAALAIGLNMFFIPRYGIEGSAIATLIAIFLYSLSKLMFVVFRMKLYPFSRETLYALGVSVATFAFFYFWDFGLHPLANIVLKAGLMSVFYAVVVYRLQLSREINEVIEKFLARLAGA
jgi:O-antigen/teichoic acid export membrane protein